MPTRITHFLHSSSVTTSRTLGTSFTTTNVHAHDLQAKLPSFQSNARNFRGIVQGLHIKVTSIGAATKCTMRICADAAGDEILIPDTEATLVPGITTATTAAVAYQVDLPVWQLLNNPGNGVVYVFVKVDAGTPTWAQSILTWQE